jgi:hypothetical protein
MIFSLLTVDFHFEGGDDLAFLFQDGDHIHRSAAGYSEPNQLHRAKSIVISSDVRMGTKRDSKTPGFTREGQLLLPNNLRLHDFLLVT